MDQAVEITVMRELLQALIADREEPTQESQATFNWDPPSEMDPPVVRGCLSGFGRAPSKLRLCRWRNTSLNYCALGLASMKSLYRSSVLSYRALSKIGRVQLRPIRAADFERWIAVAGGLNTLQSRLVFDQAQRKMQGWAAATLSVHGEEHYALDVARQEADEAVAILRLFAPSILSPVGRSFCALWGRHNLESTDYVMMQKDSGRVSLGTHADTRQGYVWRITPERLALIKRDALDTIIRSMYSGTRTEFQDEVRSALLLYSKSTLRSTPADKLLAILIPMESLLLRTQSEPITDTIATRLAFSVGTGFDERKQIADVTRQAYALRSGYVHHGREIHALKDLDVLREFMRYAWMLFMEMAARSADNAERFAYLSNLDDRKFA
jgi:hypothetical protein